ncbi:hypothetical protein [Chondromyces crocatus]|uniref:Uncharacterized protein n=1 Tax=Chondromyces crocatus TaxID=52 RepID=A0A0K1E790_CHOCO|nr:hypothetical protein [Chondromyces crocatus]AKT36719.1 uncharacterized protein CMC5_008400 [Chondromyces crocatus]
MARLIGMMNEGSLLRRTLIHVCAFALGSVAFVTVVSVMLVTITRAVLPTEGESAATVDEEEALPEEGAATDKPTAAGKPLRTPRRLRNAVPTTPAIESQ